MITTIAAALVLAAPADEMVCAVNNDHAADGKLFVEYAGMKVNFCCEGCVEPFTKAPAKTLEASAKNEKTVAEFYFDPVTGKKANFKRSRATAVYNGVKYYFASAANKAEFEKNPKKYATVPKKESLHCAVMDQPVASYGKADSYVDHEGVRYYMCCLGCLEPMQKEPGKYAAKGKITEAKVIKPAKK